MSNGSAGTKITFTDGTVGIITGTPGESYRVVCGVMFPYIARPIEPGGSPEEPGGSPEEPGPDPVTALWDPDEITVDGGSSELIASGGVPPYTYEFEWIDGGNDLEFTEDDNEVTVNVIT